MPTDASAQGFLKKLKAKAEAAMQKVAGKDSKDTKSNDDEEDEADEADDTDMMQRMTKQAGPAVPEGTDVVPKQRAVIFEWNGTVAPSKATSIAALYAELPSLPAPDKMAKSTQEEREAYYKKLGAVLTRAEQLRDAKQCTDAEIIAARDRLMKKYQNMYGLSDKDMAILQDENAPQAQKDAIGKRLASQQMGIDISALEKLQSMPEEQRQAYMLQHPELMQQMMKGSMAAAAKHQKNNAAEIAYTQKMVDISKRMKALFEYSQSFNCDDDIQKYDKKVKGLVEQLIASDDQATVDRLNDEVDGIVANYRTEVARSYRAYLQKIITDSKKIADDQHAAIKQWADQEGLPECIGDIALCNGLISVGNNLGRAFMELPDLHYYPVKKETFYQLPEDWMFCEVECGHPFGTGARFQRGAGDTGSSDDADISVSDVGQTFSCQWPLLLQRIVGEGEYEYAVLECGKVRKIDQQELDQINRQTKSRRKVKAKGATAFGKYKSRNGKREIVYEQTGELVINGMYSFTPILFSQSAERLQWLQFEGGKVVKCTYKL